MRRQVRDKAHGVGHDHLGAIVGQFDPAHRGVQRGKEHVFGQHLGPGQVVEKRRFPGVCIAHKGDDGKRHLGAGGSVQFAGFDHLVQLAAQAVELFVNGAAVGLDLGFTGAADKSQTAPLPFQVGPGADKAGALIGQSGHFHL